MGRFPPTAAARFELSDTIWIFGHPRSGTTWLAQLLRDAFNAKLWNEPNIGPFLAVRGNVQRNEPTRMEDPTFWFSDPQREHWLHSLHLFLADVVGRQAGGRGEYDHLIIKEPNGSIVSSLLGEIMPEARIVMMVRDPRDVTASLLDARKPGSWMAQRVTAEYDRATIVRQTIQRTSTIGRQIRKLRMICDPLHYFEMKYEALRSDPTAELRRMAEQFALDLNVATLTSAVKEHTYENLPEETRGPGKFVRTANVGGWREELAAEEVHEIERSLASYMGDHGYESSN